ncbi:MAG: mandelate racemase/muconate lactonizing enzyme family protein [Candidatus Omnitrophica bacterium]|nr:mandelate racemase/muconate lactonizing enzyme family protein [Candidatus Omnitrophota bacterium]
MNITKVETLHCDAGWRPWTFIKISTDDGLIGYSECTDSHGSPRGIAGCVKDLEPLLLGQDPRPVEKLYWDLYRATRQSPGSIVQKAIAGIENALLDIKAKALGVPVSELFGGPLRDRIRVYWSHCWTTRARSWQHIGTPPLRSLDDVAELGREAVRRGFTALKTNIVIPGDPPSVLMQGFKGGFGSTDQNVSRQILEALGSLIGTFRNAVGDHVDICLDLNFNFKTEGNRLIAKAMEPFRLMWLELDCYDPRALRQIKDSTTIPLCSGEDLYTTRDFRPFMELQAMDVAAVDVCWNGFIRSKQIAELAELYEMNVAPHNHYSHLATMICAQFCAAIPNLRILEVDVDDVPWKDELVTASPEIRDGYLAVSRAPGWGAELNEEVLRAHPWPPTSHPARPREAPRKVVV